MPQNFFNLFYLIKQTIFSFSTTKKRKDSGVYIFERGWEFRGDEKYVRRKFLFFYKLFQNIYNKLGKGKGKQQQKPHIWKAF